MFVISLTVNELQKKLWEGRFLPFLGVEGYAQGVGVMTFSIFNGKV